MIAAAAAVSSAIWQWCTQLMAPWIPMGLEESMMVWFGSVDIGSCCYWRRQIISGLWEPWRLYLCPHGDCNSRSWGSGNLYYCTTYWCSGLVALSLAALSCLHGMVPTTWECIVEWMAPHNRCNKGCRGRLWILMTQCWFCFVALSLVLLFWTAMVPLLRWAMRGVS